MIDFKKIQNIKACGTCATVFGEVKALNSASGCKICLSAVVKPILEEACGIVDLNISRDIKYDVINQIRGLIKG